MLGIASENNRDNSGGSQSSNIVTTTASLLTTFTMYILTSLKRGQSLVRDTCHYLGIGFPIYWRGIHLVHVKPYLLNAPFSIASTFQAYLRSKKQ